MRLLLSLPLMVVASASMAQTLTPLAPASGSDRDIRVGGFFSRFETRGGPNDYRNGFAITADANFGRKFFVGGWYANHRDIGESRYDSDWFSVGGGYRVYEDDWKSFGMRGGYLSGTFKADGETVEGSWIDLGLVASFRLDPAGKFRAGLNGGYALGQKGDAGAIGAFRPSNAWTYGASLEYKATDRLSVVGSLWRLDYSPGGAGTQTLANVGATYRF